jgi:hypothetical protein
MDQNVAGLVPERPVASLLHHHYIEKSRLNRDLSNFRMVA